MVGILKRSVLEPVRWLGYDIVKRRPEPEVQAPAPEPEPIALVETATPPHKDIALYKKIYGEDSVDQRRFLNIGAGSWKHPVWQNVEYPTEHYANDLKDNVDIEWDATSTRPIPVEDNSIELIFCSHTIEHLLPEHDRHIFRECYRILKPGGIVRFITPNFHLYYGAYKRGDGRFFPYPELVEKHSLEQVLVYEFASMLSDCETEIPGFKISTEEARKILSEKPMAEALDQICEYVDYERNRVKPNHVSWWTPEKVVAELIAVGFNAYPSAFGQSLAHVMRDTTVFDTVQWWRSLYAEAVKPGAESKV
ncbi:hypothetical protein ASE66_28905 [Bosea sp. Root483D1]|uniref:class I SAM-dependent methyltransferase n=1 Tax=Bosea sp. Root483D1 TaxID=1736544 RepID=UPI00070DB93B|nr:methyltransferase domain-containing protein [Bosea sp. Root483D1]KRE21442.1 hypothetical protein ASE66_28905 [Bosea sp. Root483D1]